MADKVGMSIGTALMVSMFVAVLVNYLYVLWFLVGAWGEWAILLFVLTPLFTGVMTPVLWVMYGFSEVPAPLTVSWFIVVVPGILLTVAENYGKSN